MTRPQVSVIIRSMARATLDDALAAVGAQRDVDVEVLVVAACGASHPEVARTCGPYPVRLIRSPRPLPRAAAANAGLIAATGAWLTFLDDDDAIEPTHLAGLLAASREAPDAGVITSCADAVHRDGRVESIGQPFSLAQLFERNFIHLSSAIFARELVDQGCRFDETLEVLEDWDFVLQLAQRTQVRFVPLRTFRWNAESGDSGAGRGDNHDAVRFAANRDRVYAKWAAAHDSLVSRTQPLLEHAAEAARVGRLAEADALCGQILSISVNDPWALNLRAMVLRASGRLEEARAAQAFACAVRPDDGSFVYNLALLDRALGDVDAARRHARQAVRLEPRFQPAHTLVADLG